MEERAKSFREVRRIHLSCESAEDYTEMVADLIEAQGEARICDLAKKMGISHVTVLKTIRRLIRDGYIVKGEGLILTEKGKETAAFSKRRHLILSEFFRKLGVPEEVAATDVEGIEHHISFATLRAIEAHLST